MILALGVLVALLLSTTTAGAAPRKVINDPSATPNWTLQINGSGASLDAATSVLADSGGAYVGGWAGNSAGNWDATLARVSTTGALKWMKRYDGPSHKNDLVWKLAKGPSGTIYGVGWTVAANDKTNILVVKWKANGRRVWAKTYDGAAHGDDRGLDLGVDKYGNVIVAGSTKTANGLDYLVVKWASNGARKWVRRYSGSAHLNDEATDIYVEGGGTAYVTGNMLVTGPRSAVYTVKLSASGKKAWARSYLGEDGLGAGVSAIVKRRAGGVYIGGWTQGVTTGKDVLVLRYSRGGSPWKLPSFGLRPGDDAFNDVAVATNGAIVGVGYVESTAADSYFQKWANETTLNWASWPLRPFDDAYTAVTADAYGGVYCTGYERTAANLSQIRTQRASMTSGSGFQSVWGPALGLDQPTGIAASGTTVYVAGTTYKDAAEQYNQVVLIYAY